MKTRAEIEGKLKELKEYLSECESRCVTSTSAKWQIKFLEGVLNELDRVPEVWAYIKGKVGPFYYAEDRKILKEKQDEFYQKNMRGKNKNSEKYKKLDEEYKKMEVPDYDEISWDFYLTLGWVMGEKDAHGEVINI